MGDSGTIRPTDAGLTRRDLLRLGAATTVAALVPTTAAAAPPPGKKPGGSPPPTTIVDPYTGSIPLFFPLTGDYVQPVVDNWHDNRDGNYGYAWSHQNSPARRAHDGIDIFPLDRSTLPPVYTPFAARVVDVNVEGYKRVTDSRLAPPWNYGQGDGNIYGNYVWLCSTEEDGSKGFFAFYCHLKADPTLWSLADRLADSIAQESILLLNGDAQVGILGDTGNATNDPQLHMEIHYPIDTTFTCTRCTRKKSGMTAINPFPSLSNAKSR